MNSGSEVVYESVSMDGRRWFSRNRGGGWRTMIDVRTGRATGESCFVEDRLFEAWLSAGRATARTVDVGVVAATHRWFTETGAAQSGPKA